MEGREARLQIPTPSSSPWLLYTHGNAKAKNIQTFCTVTASNYNKSYIKSIPALRGKGILAFSNGWFILYDNVSDNKFFLWHPVTSNLIDLPPISDSVFDITLPITSCILTCSPHGNNDNCIVLIFCYSFVFSYIVLDQHEPQHGNWVCLGLQLEIEGLEVMGIEAALANNGVIYALAYTQRPDFSMIEYLVTLELKFNDYEDHSIVSVTLGPLHLLFPSFNVYPFMKHYLIESCGLVYIVAICMVPYYRYKRINAIKIWKLDLGNVTWVEVDSLDGRAFFLDNKHGPTWCWANNNGVGVGVEPNSVYFLSPADDILYLYRLHDHSLTPLCPKQNLVKPFHGPTWVVMPHHHQRSCEKRQELISNDQQVKNIVESEELPLENRTLNDLISLFPIDLIVLISNHMHLFDYLSFRVACKSLRSELPLPQWRTHNSLPLFLFSNKDGGLWQIMDPCRNDSRSISIPLLSGFENFIDFSKNGWLIFGMGGQSLKYFNLFTGVSGDFPSFDDMNLLRLVGFSTCPTSSDCLTIGILESFGTVTIAHYLSGKEAWEIEVFEDEDEDERFLSVQRTSSPVFLDGGFHFLYQSGHVGFFELEQGESNLTDYQKKPKLLSTYYSNHLVECDGQLLYVFIGDLGKWVQVFRYNHSKRTWFELKSLRNNILFISHNTSFSVVAPESGLGNRIYLPRLYHNGIVYYSLETGKFHTSDGEHSMDNLYGTIEPLRCCWV